MTSSDQNGERHEQEEGPPPADSPESPADPRHSPPPPPDFHSGSPSHQPDWLTPGAPPPRAPQPPAPQQGWQGAPPPPPPNPYPGGFDPMDRAGTNASLPLPKPGMVTAIAIISLVQGVLSLLVAFAVLLGSMCVWLPWILGMVAGGMGIAQGVRMINDPYYPPNNAVAILFICCIINCDVTGLICGILLLIFRGSPEVQAYYAAAGNPL